MDAVDFILARPGLKQQFVGQIEIMLKLCIWLFHFAFDISNNTAKINLELLTFSAGPLHLFGVSITGLLNKGLLAKANVTLPQ